MKKEKQSQMFDKLLERYLKGYITDGQLERYVTLGQITQEEADLIRLSKNNQ